MSAAAKIFAALILLLTVGAGVSVLALPDATLRALPGGHGERLVSIRRDTRDYAAYRFEDVSYAAKSLFWDLTSGHVFDTGVTVEIEIPPDVRKQLRQASRRPKMQSSNTPKLVPNLASQTQIEAAPATTKAAAPPSPELLASSSINMAQKQEIAPKSILEPAADGNAHLSATGTENEQSDNVSPSALMTKQILPLSVPATVPPVAKTSSLQKSEAPKKKPTPVKAKTAEKKPALAQVKIAKPASLPNVRPPLEPANQAAKGEVKKLKQVATLTAEPGVQSTASARKSRLPPLLAPTPKPVLSRTPVTPKKPSRKVAKRSAADSEDGADAHQRGLLHYRGNTVPKNLWEAAKWFRIAANNGHAGAQYNLGIMAFLGQGMTKDYAKAAKWFRMAGEQDYAPAQYNLGFLYYVGRGVERDDVNAYIWIDRAASLGDKKAQTARDTLRQTLSPEILPK